MTTAIKPLEILQLHWVTIDRRFKSFSDVTLAITLLSPSESRRSCLTSEERQSAKAKLNCLSKETEDVIDMGEKVQNKETSITFEQIANPVEAAFSELCFPSAKKLRSDVNNETAGYSNFDEELSQIISSVDEDKSAFTFFRENKKWPRLSSVARILLCLFPSPANAERAFSKASFLTENRINRLSCQSIKTRLIGNCE